MMADNKPAKYAVPQTLGVAIPLLVVAIAVSLLAWRGYEPVLRLAAYQWAISDTLDPADAVVVLGGGTPDRPHEAVELYFRGMASRILLDDDGDQKLVLGRNVPPQAVVMFGSGLRNTYEESCALVDWAKKNGAQRFIIPTELFSSRRVRWIFAHKLDDLGAHVVLDVVRPSRYTPDDWWLNRDGRAQFLTEIAKYFYYRVRYAFAQC